MAWKAATCALVTVGLAEAFVNPLLGPCNAGPVGTCGHLPCYPDRGPTQCIGNSCMCATGYCKYGTNNLRCRAEVPGTSCTVLKVCWTGGLISSTCVDGHCLCRTEMHIGADGKCHSGWWPDKEGMANSTLVNLAEVRAEEDAQVLKNVAIAFSWCAFAAVVMATALWRVRCTLHRPLPAKEEEPGAHYKKLPEDPSLLVTE